MALEISSTTSNCSTIYFKFFFIRCFHKLFNRFSQAVLCQCKTCLMYGHYSFDLSINCSLNTFMETYVFDSNIYCIGFYSHLTKWQPHSFMLTISDKTHLKKRSFLRFLFFVTRIRIRITTRRSSSLDIWFCSHIKIQNSSFK
ncbi:hypothetical protein CLU83_0478 [Flavobacterium sp. 1]|nr:hypothetical protein CLU83_0478 [Flavobacterium sp. 1]